MTIAAGRRDPLRPVQKSAEIEALIVRGDPCGSAAEKAPKAKVEAGSEAQIPFDIGIFGVFKNARHLAATGELGAGERCAADEAKAGCERAIGGELEPIVALVADIADAAIGEKDRYLRSVVN